MAPGNVTQLSHNKRSSSSLNSPGVSSILSSSLLLNPQSSSLSSSMSLPVLPSSFSSSTSTAEQGQILSSQTNSLCDPNSIIYKHAPYFNSKRGGMSRHEAESAVKTKAAAAERASGLRRCQPPKNIFPRHSGRIHLDGPETVHSMVPLSVDGNVSCAERGTTDTDGRRRRHDGGCVQLRVGQRSWTHRFFRGACLAGCCLLLFFFLLRTHCLPVY